MDFTSDNSSVFVRSLAATGLAVALVVILFGRVAGQQEPSPVVDKSPDNLAAGPIGDEVTWDLSATDCTFKVDKREVWVVDSHSADEPFILKFKADDLAVTVPESMLLRLPPELAGSTVLGIAEVPHGELQGLNFVLIDTTFGTTEAPDPRIGVYGDDGTLVNRAEFNPVVGADPAARLTSISVNPDPGVEEMVAYDAANHEFYVLDFPFFTVVRGPTKCHGFRNFFADSWSLSGSERGMGMGITYNGPDTVLITEGFYNEFETRFALEYDAGGSTGYTGRALDLSAASQAGAIDLVFTSLAAGLVGDEDVLFALNVSDESLYAFSPTYEEQATPVRLRSDCVWDPLTGQYSVTWELDAGALVDSVLVFENGVQVAALPPDATEFQSELPMVGKVFVEVATEKGGVVSGVRPICELENAQRPSLPDVDFPWKDLLEGITYGDLAVTKTPASAAEFRMYIFLSGFSSVGVLDHTLTVLESYPLTEPRTETAVPRQAIGLTLAPLEGTTHLVALDPNGFDESGFASAAFFPLAEGDDPGVATRVVDTIDLTGLPESLALRNWDHVDDGTENGYYVAAGSFDDGGIIRFVLVRIEFSDNLMHATNMVHIPQRSLSPFVDRPLAGLAVSALPSGHLLVAGGNTFLDSYTEAVLATRFDRDESTAVRLVGYAQGLPGLGEIYNLGAGLNSRRIHGLATAYFPPADGELEGVGVTYNVPEVVYLTINPSGLAIPLEDPLAIHTENEVSHPGLVAEQLLETDLLFQSGQTRTTAAVSASFANDVSLIDYYVTLVNLSGFLSVPASVDVLLDGVVVPEAGRDVVFEPGRNLRLRIPERLEKTCEVRILNSLDDATEIRVVIGATAVSGEAPQPEASPFLRGDCNADGHVQLTDAVFGLGALFQGAEQPACLDACDLDDGGSFNIGDMIAILSFLFQGAGNDPAPPGPDVCGRDPVDDVFADCVYDACP